MKYAILGLVALTSFALVSAENFYEQPGYEFRMEERLGHFASAPFTDLYKQYAVATQPTELVGDRPADDYRNYRPSADVCRNFFATFQGQSYSLNDLDELIVLDACLGYVVDGVFENDKDASEANKDYFRSLDSQATKLYDTNVDSFGNAEKSCLADLLLNVVLAKKEFPEVECNNHMLQMYIQFAECQAATPLSSHRDDDTYVSNVYRLVRERVNRCVDVEVEHINQAVRRKFGKEWYKRASLTVARSVQKKQQLQRKWPTPVVTLLAAVQNTQDEVNLRQVHQLLTHAQQNDEILKEHFLKNMAAFANKRIKPKKGSSSSGTDPRGVQRYKELIDKTCNVFRSSDSEKDYDFATPIIRMVELLNHVEIFGVARDDFVRKLVTHTYEAAPLYLSVSACNMLTFTEGTYDPTSKGSPVYEVHFVPNTKKMVVWPKASYV